MGRRICCTNQNTRHAAASVDVDVRIAREDDIQDILEIMDGGEEDKREAAATDEQQPGMTTTTTTTTTTKLCGPNRHSTRKFCQQSSGTATTTQTASTTASRLSPRTRAKLSDSCAHPSSPTRLRFLTSAYHPHTGGAVLPQLS
ncbi:N-acetyltransferase domain-containing protein [Pycnococcus provasolii]